MTARGKQSERALYFSFPTSRRGRSLLNANLGHVRPTGADGTKAAARFLDGKEQGCAEAGPEEPHECGTGLDLTAALLSIVGAEANPIARETLVSEVAAVDCLQLGGQDNGVDEGEKDS